MKIKSALLCFLALFLSSASAQENMKVLLNSGDSMTYRLSNIRSISFRLGSSSSPREIHRIAEIKKLFASIFPNPSRGMTTIRYTLMANAKVNIGIYDVKGRLVKTLVNQATLPGKHTVLWNALDEAGKRVTSGQYIARISIDDRISFVNRVFLFD